MKRIKRFLFRMKIAWKVLHERHCLCISINEGQLTDLISDNKIEGPVKMKYFGLMEHQCYQVIKHCADQIDETEIICMKANFEALVYEQLDNKNELY